MEMISQVHRIAIVIVYKLSRTVVGFLFVSFCQILFHELDFYKQNPFLHFSYLHRKFLQGTAQEIGFQMRGSKPKPHASLGIQENNPLFWAHKNISCELFEWFTSIPFERKSLCLKIYLYHNSHFKSAK